MKKLIKTSANLITLFRIFLVFVMLPFLFIIKKDLIIEDQFRNIFISIFVLASITDFLDGYIAKKFKQQTIFGKFFDPIADKLLVIVSFFYIYILSTNDTLLTKGHNKHIERLLLSVLLINIIRDFLVMGVRLIAFEQKTIITASFLGKLKTIFTFISIFLMLISKKIETRSSEISMILFNQIFLIINMFLIIWSGIDYIIKNFKFIKNNF
ncbi:CDP-diacylglycerol--glycerol-3-phosphate 3-phosphatidyltransferase [Candidatus Phytoplasma ziziphi]|uniref:CDP-diacylglycerol--glycerol-3-phosphate 3-phosphatidyltransferase n=1 Tax=Candidatus Phytoplasma TaxID=33926 RepID=UPI001EDF0B03|nr:CDP-diacylglycerol--glycerol-3-phosphate 3-phosphatidyltransferase [Candidatus Phytoplasma ziziphi]